MPRLFTGRELAALPVTVWVGGYGDRHQVATTVGSILGDDGREGEYLDRATLREHVAGFFSARARGSWDANEIDKHAAYKAIVAAYEQRTQEAA